MIRLFMWFSRTPDPIDLLIAERGARMRFTGFDPSLRERTEEKRKEAERLERASRRVASSPPQGRALRRIG
ncbi:MAG TPA: hypothetical protein VIC33_02700 [Vicinamibacterales bacterium]|jgi:hypothetical protein